MLLSKIIATSLASVMIVGSGANMLPMPEIEGKIIPTKDEIAEITKQIESEKTPEPCYVLVCHTTEHKHSEECYPLELSCDKAEDDGHIHGDSCFTEERVLACGLEEYSHTHDDSCYSEKTTCVCGMEESEEEGGHHHTAECMSTEKVLICGIVEGSHTHSDDCYSTKKVLSCGQTEHEAHHHSESCYKKSETPNCGMIEHKHSAYCWSDVNADVETQKDWDKMFEDFKLTGIWGKDLLAVAMSQMDEKESPSNFIYDENGRRQGYTRYSDWYNRTVNYERDEEWLQKRVYDAWCASFVSFCLNYAGIPRDAVCWENGCSRWVRDFEEAGIYESGFDGYIPNPGDIVFFSFTGGHLAEHVGVVKDVDLKNGIIYTVEGNNENMVLETYYYRSSCVMIGFVNIAKAQTLWNAVTAAKNAEQRASEIKLIS